MLGKIDSDNSNNQFGIFQLSGSDKAGAKKTAKSVNAAGFNHAFDPYKRLNSAKKHAMNFIKEALAGELDIDRDMERRNEHIRELGATISNSKDSLNKINSELASLRKEYGIEPDSIEEKELSFLVQADKARSASPTGQLSPEMQEKVDEITSHLTEYQEKALPKLLEKEYGSQKLSDAERDILVENMTLRSAKIERLKSDPIGDAWDKADALTDAAEKELISALYSEAQENIEEDLEETFAEAKEAADKKEEAEERIDTAKSKKEEEKETTEDILDAIRKKNIIALDMSDPGSEINELLSKLKLIEYDVKGAVIDENL